MTEPVRSRVKFNLRDDGLEVIEVGTDAEAAVVVSRYVNDLVGARWVFRATRTDADLVRLASRMQLAECVVAVLAVSGYLGDVAYRAAERVLDLAQRDLGEKSAAVDANAPTVNLGAGAIQLSVTTPITATMQSDAVDFAFENDKRTGALKAIKRRSVAA